MDDEILSITGRPVPRLGSPEPHWGWNALAAAACPLLFLPRHIARRDWIGTAAWTLLLVAGIVRSRWPAKPFITSRALVAVILITSAVLVFVVKEPMWRVIGLVVAVAAILTEFALAKVVHKTQ